MSDLTGLSAQLERPGLQDQVVLASLVPGLAIAASDPDLLNVLARLIGQPRPHEGGRPTREED